VADALGVAAFRDECGAFYAVRDATVWVRLTLWGFSYADVQVCWRMLTYATVWVRLTTCRYADVC
jgi:hypothetical protein